MPFDRACLRRHGVLGLLVFSTLPPLCADEIVYADGRREPAAAPRMDSKGGWTVEREGRRMVVRPGEVVAIVDAAGSETVLIPALVDAALAPEDEAALSALRDAKNEAWMAAAERLGAHPTRGALDALTALASDRAKELRKRAIHALARLRTRESVAAATAAILAEQDKALRREAASVLFSVQEIFARCDLADRVKEGLGDQDAVVRLCFASLAPAGVTEAIAVLKADGLPHRDHHFRESAAVELGRRGDASGEAILSSMLARAKLPGFDGDTTLMEQHLVREQVEICRIFGTLATAGAKAALRKAATSRHAAVREAAKVALEAAGSK